MDILPLEVLQSRFVPDDVFQGPVPSWFGCREAPIASPEVVETPDSLG
jgi:hypothetical protein